MSSSDDSFLTHERVDSAGFAKLMGLRTNASSGFRGTVATRSTSYLFKIRTTILPFAWPSLSFPYALGTSSNANTSSMTGFTLP
jgi:hypothetical protein